MGEMHRLKAQCSLKKNGKEEELMKLQQEIEDSKKLLGEEELVIFDLNEEINSLKVKRNEIMKEVENSEMIVRQKYSRMLEALENYNKKLKDDLNQINAVKSKMLGGPGAL